MRLIFLLFLLISCFCTSTLAVNVETSVEPLPVSRPKPEVNSNIKVEASPKPELESADQKLELSFSHESLNEMAMKEVHSELIDPEAALEKEKNPQVHEIAPIETDPVPVSDMGSVSNHRIPISIDSVSSEDYGDDIEQTKPDDVDHDAIQQLVDRFLNKGTLEAEKVEFLNKAVQELINSSDYWKIDSVQAEESIKSNDQARQWTNGYNGEAQKILKEVASAGWNYFTAVSADTKRSLDEAESGLHKFLASTSKQSRQFNLSFVTDKKTKRQLELISIEGMSALSTTGFKRYNELHSEINKIFTQTDVCEKEGQKTCILKFNDLPSIISNMKNQEEALNLWKSWRKTAGPQLQKIYAELSKLTNEGAKLNGFNHAGQMWISPFDLSTKSRKREIDLMAEVDKVYSQVEPLYKQLHAYIRREIGAAYPEAPSLSRDTPIPVHLLKHITGESWGQYYESTKPFEADDVIPEEVLASLHKQNITSKGIFIKAYRYMKYLGFEKLPKSFWIKSIFSRNWSKDMICDPATAYDMMNGVDYMIKACTQVGEPDFVLAHKLMAQLYYKYASRKQPLLFRDAPNPVLQRAVENVFGILAGNPHYMQSQRLVGENSMRDEAIMINRLYREALNELVRLPSDIVVDKWRFGVFDNQYSENNWSAVWWKLREKYQGVTTPAASNDAAQYDPVVTPRIVKEYSPAMKHFISYVIQFQILDSLCVGDSTPLSEGCIPKAEKIKKLITVMEKGAEYDWLDALEAITGTRKLNATPMLLYYEPLHNWLLNANKQVNAYIGWDGTGKPFNPEELPTVNSPDVDNVGVPSEDHIAFPGDDCTSGQECLLESSCNGTICVCNEGLFTLHIGTTYNCVQGNPADAGFGNGNNLVIGLFSNEKENATMKDRVETATTAAGKKTNSTPIIAVPVLITIFLEFVVTRLML